MRKMIVEGKPFPELISPFREYFDQFVCVEIQEILKLDFERGIRICLADIQLADGLDIEDLKLPEGSEVIRVIKREGSWFTAIMKINTPQQLIPSLQKLDLNLIWETPIFKSKDRFVFGCVGDDGEFKKLLEAVREFGEITSVRFQKPSFHSHDITECLTGKQKDVMMAAWKTGYYDYPRRTNAGELAKGIGLSKATTLEHLRKAENRLMTTILEGH